MISLLSALFASSALAVIPENYAAIALKELKKKGVDAAQCAEMETKVGQLFYMNVDGYGSPHVIDPAYVRLVKRIQPGGVLPHYNGTQVEDIRKASEKLQSASDLPLLIGVDFQSMKSGGEESTVGLGYGEGIAEKLSGQSAECYSRVAAIDAALQRYTGINNPLGPTIEKSVDQSSELAKDLEYKLPRMRAVNNAFREMGLETTLKHFPYTPSTFNLHSDSKDTKIPLDVVKREYLPIYKEMANESGMLMTTHLFNTEVDPDNLATFSKKWMKLLREDVGFKGLVMTDALFMIKNYDDSMKKMSRDWPPQEDPGLNSDATIFAVKSILAGHDMFFVESASAETEKLWKSLVKFGCENSPMAEKFRERVRESHERIAQYKKSNPGLKLPPLKLKPAELEELLQASAKKAHICEEDFTPLAKILEKFRGQAPKVDESVFPCAPAVSVVSEGLLKQIEGTNRDLNQRILPKLLADALDSKDLEEVNGALAYVAQHPEIKEALAAFYAPLLESKKTADLKRGVRAFSLLDLWRDSSFVDQALEAGDKTKVEAYLSQAERSNLPAPAKHLRKEVAAFLADKHAGKVDFDSLAADSRQSFVRDLDIIFPLNAPDTLTVEEAAALDLPDDLKFYLMARGSGYKLDAESAKKIAPETLYRFLKRVYAEDQFHGLDLPVYTCSKADGAGCNAWDRATTQPTNLARNILADPAELKVSLGPEKVGELSRLAAKKSASLVDGYDKRQFLLQSFILGGESAKFNAFVAEQIKEVAKAAESRSDPSALPNLRYQIQGFLNKNYPPLTGETKETVLKVMLANPDAFSTVGGYGSYGSVDEGDFIWENRERFQSPKFKPLLEELRKRREAK